MKRFALLAAFGLLAAAGTNPHFIRASADLRGEDLVVKWKEAGLGDNQNIDYVASAEATGFYACINGGQNHPQAANKEAFEGPVSEEGTFNSGKNGHITASLTISPPQGTLSCPPGQRRVLACVSYTDVVIADVTNGVSESIHGSYSDSFWDLPECSGY
jgi:hypothetical protein